MHKYKQGDWKPLHFWIRLKFKRKFLSNISNKQKYIPFSLKTSKNFRVLSNLTIFLIIQFYFVGWKKSIKFHFLKFQNKNRISCGLKWEFTNIFHAEIFQVHYNKYYDPSIHIGNIYVYIFVGLNKVDFILGEFQRLMKFPPPPQKKSKVYN